MVVTTSYGSSSSSTSLLCLRSIPRLFVLAAAFVLAILATTADAVPATHEIVAYFAKSDDFKSEIKTFATVYAQVLSYPETPDNVPDAYARKCDIAGMCSMAIGYTNTDADLMNQIIREVQNNEAKFIQTILTAPGVGTINIRALRVVPLSTGSPSNPDDGKSFIAKYPYVIAAIAVALVIGVIIGAVILIQKRANTLAEMEDESMLAEGEEPGFVPHANRASQKQKRAATEAGNSINNNNNTQYSHRGGGENEAVIITQGGQVISGTSSSSPSYRPPTQQQQEEDSTVRRVQEERKVEEKETEKEKKEEAPAASVQTTAVVVEVAGNDGDHRGDDNDDISAAVAMEDPVVGRDENENENEEDGDGETK